MVKTGFKIFILFSILRGNNSVFVLANISVLFRFRSVFNPYYLQKRSVYNNFYFFRTNYSRTVI